MYENYCCVIDEVVKAKDKEAREAKVQKKIKAMESWKDEIQEVEVEDENEEDKILPVKTT